MCVHSSGIKRKRILFSRFDFFNKIMCILVMRKTMPSGFSKFFCCMLTIIQMISIQRYIHTKYSNTQAGSVVSGTNDLLTSGFGSSTRGERHNSYYAGHSIWPHNALRILRCLRSLPVEIWKTPTTYLNGRELSSHCTNGRELNCLLPWSNINFQLRDF